MQTERDIQNPHLMDPRIVGPKPPYDQPTTPRPGLQQHLNVPADHGEYSYKGLGRLKGRTALITGADSGIGRAVAIAFAREGANVALSYLSDEEEDASETMRWIEEAGCKALKLPGDICEETHYKSMVERTVKELGVLDILVNNAAYQATHDSIEEFTTEEFDRSFKTNVRHWICSYFLPTRKAYAMFWLCRAALPLMQPGSAIINTTSIQAFVPSANLLSYSPTKAAIANFTKGLSQTAMKRGVRVNAVAPGPVWTPLIPSTMPEEKVKTFGQDTQFERAAQPVELAPLFVFLASNEARFVTGEIYGATGGDTPL